MIQLLFIFVTFLLMSTLSKELTKEDLDFANSVFENLEVRTKQEIEYAESIYQELDNERKNRGPVYYVGEISIVLSESGPGMGTEEEEINPLGDTNSTNAETLKRETNSTRIDENEVEEYMPN